MSLIDGNSSRGCQCSAMLHLLLYVVIAKFHYTGPTGPDLVMKFSYKAATDNMLQIIEAHPNWPVHAGVFEHPPPSACISTPNMAILKAD